jgi:hypothetical protein
MCSREAHRDGAVAKAASVPGSTCVVVDVAAASDVGLPELETSEFHEAQVGSHGDLSCKRNLGLALGRLTDWESILFLDDDITGLEPRQVTEAVAALDHHTAVGMPATFFQDNSVVCHARRVGGADQDVFVSGSALAVDVSRADSFFPDIYNEDWLFLAPQLDRQDVAAAGSVLQDEYLPFELPHRAGVQEFGEVVAEGLIGYLHSSRLIPLPPVAYWDAFLEARADFIAEAMQRCLAAAVHDVDADAALPALEIAEQALARISAAMLTDYVDAWTHDLATWQEFLRELPRTGDVRASLKHLGLPAVTVSSEPRAESPPTRRQPGPANHSPAPSRRLCAE